MEAKRLVPYSVHLREDIYLKLKEAAGQRKATALVRDAITLIIEGDDVFNGGYNKGLRDAIAVVKENENASSISVGGESSADILSAQIEGMILNQSVGGKNGAKKV
jgi:hypothetical protein